MRKEEFYFDSNCNTNKIHAVKWVPEGTPLCIIQIVHGMCEYVERYEEFAAFLTGKMFWLSEKTILDMGNPWEVIRRDIFVKKNRTECLLKMYVP